MGKQLAVSDEKVTTDIEERLRLLDPCIISLVREFITQHKDFAPREVQDLETDELIQHVRIKFWTVLRDKKIEYPKAYIKRIIHSEFIDMMRKRKKIIPLSFSQEDEMSIDVKVLLNASQGMSDPACEFEQTMAYGICLRKLVDSVMSLPERQRWVMICTLLDHVADPRQLALAFNERHFDIGVVQWPSEKAAKQLLQASLPYARQKVMRMMSVKMSGKRSVCHA